MIRRLPPLLVRVIVVIDLLLCVNPTWAWFLVWRWTGRLLMPHEALKLYLRAALFVLRHVQNVGHGIGAWTVGWFSPPVRRASWPDRPGWTPAGACGTCRKCCSTSWLPPEKAVSCPFLGESGCQVYGGVYWDYFNCGRYPESPVAIEAYRCPRFLPVVSPPRPDA